MRPTTIATITTAAALLAAACGGGGGGDDAARAEQPAAPAEAVADDGRPAAALEEVTLDDPAWEPATPWEAVLAQVGPDGEVTKDVALQAFEVAFGDLPGVEAPVVDTPAEGAADEVPGTVALSWLTRFEDQLTPEQLDAVRELLAPAGGSTSPTSSTSTTTGAPQATQEMSAGGETFTFELASTRRAVAPSARRSFDPFTVACTVGVEAVDEDGPGAEQYRDLVDSELRNVERALGEQLGIPVYVLLGVGKSKSETLAWVSPQTGRCKSEYAESCQMTLIADRVDALSEDQVRRVLAHELVHCFQSRWLFPFDAISSPAWLMEGFPDFLAVKMHPSGSQPNLAIYFLRAAMPLFGRGYDAQGFYFRLDEVGGDPVGKYVAAFRKQDNAAAFEHLTAGVAGFADSWSSSMMLQPDRGEAWTMRDAPPDALVAFPTAPMPNGKFVNLGAGQAQTKAVYLQLDAEVVSFRVDGEPNGRISWDGFEDQLLTEVDGVDYCAVPGGCECPEGGRDAPTEALPSDAAFATIAGMQSPSSLEVKAQKLEDFCKKKTEKPAPAAPLMDPCLVGEWVTKEWSMPALMGDAVGGEGATVRIERDGAVSWDFDEMTPLQSVGALDIVTAEDTYGTGEGTATAVDGDWTLVEADTSGIGGRLIDTVMGETRLPTVGPGQMVLLRDGIYDCSRNGFVFTSRDPVSGRGIEVDFEEA